MLHAIVNFKSNMPKYVRSNDNKLLKSADRSADSGQVTNKRSPHRPSHHNFFQSVPIGRQ